MRSFVSAISFAAIVLGSLILQFHPAVVRGCDYPVTAAGIMAAPVDCGVVSAPVVSSQTITRSYSTVSTPVVSQAFVPMQSPVRVQSFVPARGFAPAGSYGVGQGFAQTGLGTAYGANAVVTHGAVIDNGGFVGGGGGAVLNARRVKIRRNSPAALNQIFGGNGPVQINSRRIHIRRNR
jgi:hypothetical protein